LKFGDQSLRFFFEKNKNKNRNNFNNFTIRSSKKKKIFTANPLNLTPRNLTPFSDSRNNNVELAIKNQGAIIIFQVHHHDFRGKQILITFSKALIKFAIDMLYYHFF